MRLLDRLHSACDSLSSASDDSADSQFNESAYHQAEAQLNWAVAELQTVAPWLLPVFGASRVLSGAETRM